MFEKPFEEMNRRELLDAVRLHNETVRVIRNYSRKSKEELLLEMRDIYPKPKPKATSSKRKKGK